MEAILKEYHAQLVLQNREASQREEMAEQEAELNKTKKRLRTRDKIEKLVSDGAKNYPAYLKLVHTGDSDFSDDETIERQIRAKKDVKKDKSDRNEDSIDKEEIIDLGEPISSLGAASPGDEKKDATKEQRLSSKTSAGEENKEDVLYHNPEPSTPEYDNALNASTDPVTTEEQLREQEEWKQELAKLEEEIQIMRQVLSSKVNQAAELKRKLGITPIAEFRQDFRQGLQNIKDSDAYRKTNSALWQVRGNIVTSHAYQKTNAAFKTAGAKTASALNTAGAFASKKLGDMRNSNAFKSFEEKLGGAYSNVKDMPYVPYVGGIGGFVPYLVSPQMPQQTRVRGSKSENNFEDALRSSSLTEEQNGGGSMSYPASPMSPDEKVPL